MRKRLTGVMAILLPEQKQNCCSLIASLHTNTKEIFRQAQYDNKILNQVQNDEEKKMLPYTPHDKQNNQHQSLHKLPLRVRFRCNRNSNLCNLFERSRRSSVAMMRPSGLRANKKNIIANSYRQFEALEDCCAVAETKPRGYERKRLSAIGYQLLAFCLLLNIAKAQPIKPLSIGDTIPQMEFRQILNSPVSSLSLSSLKNKYVLIDFWATWCTSCIKHFDELNELQKANKESLQILLVNSPNSTDTKEKLQDFCIQYRTDHPSFIIPFVTDGSTLKQYFPHQSLPHYVWIEKGGLVSITGGEEVTKANVTAWLNGALPAMYQKNDFTDTLPLPAVVKGYVEDVISHKAIEAATIQLLNSKAKAVSNAKGMFTIEVTAPKDTLSINAFGYAPLKILLKPTLNRQKEIHILLTPQTTTLQNVTVNTGYQTIPKERVTGSFEKIDQKLLNNRVSSDILSRLENISSVYFDRRNNNQSISIHGLSTIYANAAPLIVLDNFPYDGDINNINPNDVENITILKDAAAASIWGVRAANGVIVITTKKGQYNKKPVVELNANITVGSKPNLYYAPFLRSEDFIAVEQFAFDKGYYNSAINNTTNRPVLSPVVELLAAKKAGSIPASVADAQIEALKKNDVRNDFEKYVYRNSVNRQFSLRYSGGAEKYHYALSAGYDRNTDYLVRNGSQRISLQLNNSFMIAKGLEFAMQLGWAQIQKDNNNSGSSMGNPTGKNLYPYAQLADSNGIALATPKDYRQAYLDTAGGGKLLDWKYRVLDEINMANNRYKQNDLMLQAGLNYRINQHFNISVLYRYEKQNGNTRNLYNANTYLSRNLINLFSQISAGQVKYAVPQGSILDATFTEMLSQSGRAQMNYHQAWRKEQELTMLGGFEVKEVKNNSSLYRTYGYNAGTLTYGNVNWVDLQPIYGNISASQLIPNPGSFSETQLRYVSGYFNAAFSYQKKYLLSISARKDASNLFGVSSNQKAVPLWSAGIAWNINKEHFFHNASVPLLKLRITYGYNGNVDNTVAAVSTFKYSNNAPYTGLPYGVLQNPPNNDLRWEKTAVFNAGIDFAILSGRISGSADYYLKNGYDLIGQAALDPTLGVLNPAQTAFAYKGNVANMSGKGIDINITTQNLRGRFGWNTTVIFNYNSSKVTQYNASATTAASYVGSGTLVNPVVGRPLYAVYSYRWAGLDSLTGDPRGYLNGQISKDYTNIVNASVDQLNYHGSATPLYFGSVRNSFSYKQWSLSFNIAFKLDYYFLRSSINYSTLLSQWRGHPDYNKRWQQPGDESFTQVPSFIYPISNSNRETFYNYSSVLVEKGDHIRLQDISVSYQFDSKMLAANKLFKSVQLYAYLNNLGLLWKANRSGLDPDYPSAGFPLPKTVAIGCRIQF
ncbi:MAG: SusC/RagA family TonB-linked outer membrane protein [Sphingobacteriia bacterium]|nr:SusC/RagA family TonB-linked outer membrane protein [Sphingobacteriia bacterium]